MSDTPVNSVIFAEEAATLKGKNMVAVVSGCHGSGKTWFAVTLAHTLSLLKQRVLLFDGDNGPANTQMQLGLKNGLNLDAVIYKGNSLNQAVTASEKTRFDVIFGSPQSGGLSTMSLGRLQILGDDLNILAQNYDKVVLDISSGMANSAKVLAGMSKSVIVVCTDNPRSVTGSYGLIKLITERSPKTSISIVINKADTTAGGQRTYKILEKACQEFLGISPVLLGVVREDTRVRDSIRNRTSLINRYPQSEAALDVLAIAERILQNG